MRLRLVSIVLMAALLLSGCAAGPADDETDTFPLTVWLQGIDAAGLRDQPAVSVRLVSDNATIARNSTDASGKTQFVVDRESRFRIEVAADEGWFPAASVPVFVPSEAAWVETYRRGQENGFIRECRDGTGFCRDLGQFNTSRYAETLRMLVVRPIDSATHWLTVK